MCNLVILGLILFCIYLLYRQLNYKAAAEKRLGFHDLITDLPNRTLLMQKMADLISDKKRTIFAILLIDIDELKHINASLGYETGDQLILAVANRLKTIIKADNILSHTGGDEFVIVLSDIKKIEVITDIAKRIQTAFIEPFKIDSHQIYITASIGISIYPDNGTDFKTLIKNADVAMHQAKAVGRNNFQFCTPEMLFEVEERALLQSALHQALKFDEFSLLYQPKMSLADEKISGLEALIRWNRPGKGLVSPDYFIGLAESNGLIVPIGEWMLRSVCQQVKKWKEKGLVVDNIAINISMRQFSISNFVASIKKVLNEIAIDPSLLEFEITERVFMESSSNNFSALRALKEMGIKITLDDFGTGYSALSYLRLFDVDKIKIDKSFVKAIINENSDASIINAIIVMAHSLNIKVVAEGVETVIQGQILKKYHCDEAQGFLYSTPLTADKVSTFLPHF